MTDSALRLTRGFEPGTIGRVTELHGLYYCRQWGFDRSFEAKVAEAIARFSNLYDPDRDGIWLVWHGERVVGSATLDASMADEGGKLRMRWVISDQTATEHGIGRMLMIAMLEFADARRQSIYLWTFDGLTAARQLYDKAGFTQTDARAFHNWGPPLTIQRMERPTGSAARTF